MEVRELHHDLLSTTAAEEVEDAIRRLRGLGCGIEQTGPTRFRLLHAPLSVWQDYLDFVFAKANSPRRAMVFRSVASTQDIVRNHADPRLVVLADEQSSGRGRHGRAWSAPAGGAVLMSLGHALGSPLGESLDRVQCIVAVAVAQVLEQLSGHDLIQIKWPNDLMFDGRKLAGVLVETFESRGARLAVIGIGVNVEYTNAQRDQFPREVRERVITLREIGCPHDRIRIAAAVIAQVDRHLASPHPQLLLDEWRIRNLMRSQRASFRCNGQTVVGEVVDLDADAGLIVRTDEGEIVSPPLRDDRRGGLFW